MCATLFVATACHYSLAIKFYDAGMAIAMPRILRKATVKPKNRTMLNELAEWISDAPLLLHRMAQHLGNNDEALHSEFSPVTSAIAACNESVQRLNTKVDALFKADESLIKQASNEPLAEADIDQLLALNRYLKVVTEQLIVVAKDLEPRLEAKIADPADPMYDFEIEAIFNYVLRDDDSDYNEDDDNYLSSQQHMLRSPAMFEDTICPIPFQPLRLWSEPLCWLFHELRHPLMTRAPQLSLRDLLRIGRIYVDVQVWQQYDFIVP